LEAIPFLVGMYHIKGMELQLHKKIKQLDVKAEANSYNPSGESSEAF